MPIRGQVSLELLALAAAALGILSLILAGFSSARSSAFAAIDLQEARAFAHSAEAAAGNLSLLGNGSSLRLHAHALNPWGFSNYGGSCVIAVEKNGIAEKEIKLPEGMRCNFEGEAKGSIGFSLRKISGNLVLFRDYG